MDISFVRVPIHKKLSNKNAFPYKFTDLILIVQYTTTFLKNWNIFIISCQYVSNKRCV